MTAPLTTRDAIVRALAEHDWHAADDFDWSRPCRHADHEFNAFCAVCSGDLGLMADALIASGALTDATQLAGDKALVDDLASRMAGTGSIWLTDRAIARDVLRALAAVLSAEASR